MTTFFDVESEDVVPFSETFVWDIESVVRLGNWLSKVKLNTSSPVYPLACTLAASAAMLATDEQRTALLNYINELYEQALQED